MEVEGAIKAAGSMGRYQILLLLLFFASNFFFVNTNFCFMVYGGLEDGASNRTNNSDPGFTSFVKEWDLVNKDEGYVPQLLNFFMLLGALFGGFCAGLLSDRFGRKMAVLFAVVLMGSAGAASAFSPNWMVLAVFRFFIGFSYQAWLLTLFTYLTEMTSKSNRLWIMAGEYGSFEIGFAIFSLYAYLTRNWRHVALVSNCFPILAVLGLSQVEESPRWLAQRGESDTAAKVLRKISSVNRTSEAFDEKNLRLVRESAETEPRPSGASQVPGFKYLLLESPQRGLIAPFSFIYATTCSVLFGLQLNSGNLDPNNIYLNVSLFGALKIAPVIGTGLLERYGKIGRRPMLAGSLLATGFSLLAIGGLIGAGRDDAVILNALATTGSLLLVPGLLVCPLFPIELFPTLIRSRALGLVRSIANLGSLLAPVILYSGELWDGLPYLIFGASSVLAAVLTLLCLPETRGRPLPEFHTTSPVAT